MAKITILIADDVKETRESIRRLLSFEPDLEVIGEAATGEEAVRQAERLRPDVVLMDINMPILDGIGATELIAMRVPRTSVIIISIQGEQEYQKKSLIAGAREYLVKPFSFDELVETMHRVCSLEKSGETTGRRPGSLDAEAG
jgi:pilus assembly protein CpaE